jgi:superfamily II helicase
MKQEINTTIIHCDACERIININDDNNITYPDLDICNACAITIMEEAIKGKMISIDDIKEIISRGHYKFSARKNNMILC